MVAVGGMARSGGSWRAEGGGGGEAAQREMVDGVGIVELDRGAGRGGGVARHAAAAEGEAGVDPVVGGVDGAVGGAAAGHAVDRRRQVERAAGGAADGL